MRHEIKRELFSRLYDHVDGYQISNQSRSTVDHAKTTFTYGEIEFDSFIDMLERIPDIQNKKVFYDLGSGTGKAVIAAGLSNFFSKVCGIELLDNLHAEAQRIRSSFEKEIKPLYRRARITIEFIQDDLFRHTYDDADVIFIHTTTCMDEEMLERLQEHLKHVKHNAIVVTATKSLGRPFDIMYSEKFKMGWGVATIYYHQKN